MKHKTIALVGGGSGGHITPLLPVAQEILRIDDTINVVHIGHKKDSLNSITKNSTSISATYEVSAGKYRRYHGDTIFSKMLDVKSLFFNTRDFFRFIHGIIEAWFLLGKLRPSAILMKGGYVCAPVGIAARLRHIPYITHDSDAMVSLAHRMIAGHAHKHATAMPPKYYPEFDMDKTVQTGIPIRSEFHHISHSDLISARKNLSIPQSAKVVFVTGGGNGSQNINEAIFSGANELLQDKDVYILHVTGQKLYEETVQGYRARINDTYQSRVHIEPFTDEIHLYSAAADVIVIRAGATNLAEFATQAKACIVIPNPLLTGGHQLKNAKVLEENGAAIIVLESDLSTLPDMVASLLEDKNKQLQLGAALEKTVHKGAALTIAKMLIEMLD